MSRPSLWRELGVALALSVAGAVAFHGLAGFVGTASALRLVVLGSSAAYALALLGVVRTRIGRVVAIAGGVALGAGLCVLDPPFVAWVLAATFAFWLLRCCYVHARPGAALGDAALSTFALMAGWYGMAHSRSLFLALWAYFLVQALWTLIPAAAAAPVTAPAASGSRFDHAERAAEAALRRLSLRH